MKRQVDIRLMMTTVGAMLALGVLSFGTSTASATAHHDDNITICHATHSDSNPYVSATVDPSAIDEENNRGWNGHGDHEGDIIPPFGDFLGRNWTDGGRAILANGCDVPEADHSVTVQLCHATGSNDRPYELVKVTLTDRERDDESLAAVHEALDLAGHQWHTGPVWTVGIDGAWGDIIPAFTYTKHGHDAQYDGYNWNDTGKRIYADKCVITVDATTTTPPTSSTTTTVVAQQPPEVADASGALPTTGSDQTLLLVIGGLMVLGGLCAAYFVRRPHHA
jgi:LPXTG-motif cell wall-anchored protein